MNAAEAATERYPHDFHCVLLRDGTFSTWRVGRVTEVDGMVRVADDDMSSDYPRSVVSDLWPVGGLRVDRGCLPGRRRAS